MKTFAVFAPLREECGFDVDSHLWSQWRDSMIEKAVVPVAGLGTRLLPATKSQPKEMLPVGRKPTVQYVIEELASQGIRDILFVTGWKKRAIEDHFDDSPELMDRLVGRKSKEALQETLSYGGDHLNFFYTRQKQPNGLGDAVSYAESFAGGEPFVVALGDAIIRYEDGSHLLRRMMESHVEHRSSCTVAVAEVSDAELGLYGVVKPKVVGDIDAADFEIADVVEKPSAESAPSRCAIAARYVFGPAIFDAIRRTKPVGEEIGLSHAIRVLLETGESVRCVKLEPNERRYDIGNHESYFKAFIDFAVEDKKCGAAIRAYLKEMAGRL